MDARLLETKEVQSDLNCDVSTTDPVLALWRRSDRVATRGEKRVRHGTSMSPV